MTPRRDPFTPEALLSAPVFGLTFLWVLVIQVSEWASLGENPGSLALRLILALVVQLVMFAFPFATWHVICPRVATKNWTWLLIASVVIGAAVRGIVFGILLVRTGVTQTPDLLYRVIASISHLAVITIIVWFLVSEVRGLHALRRQLIAEREQLLDLQSAAQHDLAQLGDRATEGIRHSILESLGGLESQDSAELRERLRTTIDDVVRPLSHQLAATPSAWSPPQALTVHTGVDWPLAIREGLDPVRIHPVILPVLLLWLGLPIHLLRFGPTLTSGFAATLVVTIPTLWLARKVAIRITDGRGAGAKAAAFVGAVLIGGLALGLATLRYMQDQPQPFLFVLIAPPLALLIAGSIAIAQAARDQDLDLDAELRATTADLQWALARVRERYRQQEGALARALHGRMQASLSAAFLRLDRAVAQGADDDTLRAALRSDVLQAIGELDVIDADPDPIDKVVDLLVSNWAGAVQLEFALEDRACEALAGDPLCARSVNELIPELVFNSIRHGSASVIEVRLETVDDRTLCLSVIDDGQTELITTRYGLGSTLLDEASITWTRSRHENRTTTTCVLPFAHQKSGPVTP
jgi:signal transduction histidine kinase